VAGALALALSPALAGFSLLPWLAWRWGAVGWTAAWIIAATGLAAGAGGFSSPAILGLALGPACVVGLGRPWLAAATAASMAGYLLAGILGRPGEGVALGLYPAILGAASLAFAFALVAISKGAAPRNELGQRIAEVSHELRTPLTHILGFSEMIERKIFGDVDERYVEYAGLIRRSGAHLLGLVNDLLDLSRIESGRYELDLVRFDVRSVVEDVVRLSADAATKKSINLGMITPETPLFVRADERALKRILINTLGNAVKFTPEGGRVIVSASAAAGALTLDTIDNGAGIPEAERERLGQAYERGAAGAQAEGTGLGLSLVRALAALHGGTLSFHDAPGGGALVRVSLPVLAQD
jgi:cell cycle sensor histidine kinase DivJ